MILRSATIAHVCLVAMFPGFFFYHYLAGIEVMPLFAGGWASNANVVAAATLLPVVGVAIIQSHSKITPHIPALGFVIVVALYASFFWIWGADYQQDSSLLIHSAKLILGVIALYCVGFLVADATLLRCAAFATFGLMSLIVFIHTDWSVLTFTIPERTVPTGQISDYQGFATAFAIIAILVIAAIRPLGWLLIAISGGAACLFLIGSRGDMLGFGLAVLAAAAVAGFKRDYVRACAVPTAYAAPIILLLALPALMSGIPAEPVVFETPSALESDAVASDRPSDAEDAPVMRGNLRNQELLDIGSSRSLDIRMEALRTGWNGIVASPIVGDYAGQVRDHGQFGMYVHNILSAWQQFGIAGFLLYAGLSLGAVGYSACRIVAENDDSFLMIATLLVAVYSVGLIFLTKSVFWPMPALAWGMAAARYSTRHRIGTA